MSAPISIKIHPYNNIRLSFCKDISKLCLYYFTTPPLHLFFLGYYIIVNRELVQGLFKEEINSMEKSVRIFYAYKLLSFLLEKRGTHASH